MRTDRPPPPSWIVCVASCIVLTLALPPVRAAGPDLLEAGRRWRIDRGMPEAARRMAVALPRVDAGGGGFERRVLAAAADVRLVPPDSVAALPMSMRGRIGVFLVLGYLHEHSHAKRLIDRAIAELHRLGYRAAILDVAPRQPVAADADRLLDGIRRELEHVDRAILVGFSKGACAISWMLLESAGELTRRQRAKIGAVITVAGVVRGSCFARWMGDRETPDTLALKLLINLKSRAPVARFDDLRSLRADPWAARPRGSLGQAFPGLTWISYAVLPDGPDGHVRSHALFGCISRAAGRALPQLGPNDGMVETGAALPPPGAGIPVHIVRVWGSHATLDGIYASGVRVAPSYHRSGTAGRRAGVEFMDTLLRSLPRRWVWAGG